MIYGTAWKEDDTEDLVYAAIKTGFRSIDTANQRRHYNEPAVGIAISRILKEGIKRKELFLQTKFTYSSGQDHRIPYDIHADYDVQVRQSFQSSLVNLKTNYIDSYLLHGPSTSEGLKKEDWQVWKEMESLHKEKKVLQIGTSNTNIKQLKILWDDAKVKPMFVQNRCYAQLMWDKEVRDFCKDKNIIYQGFSLLTANSFVLPKITHIAERVKKTPAQVIFKFSKDIGILPLTGTTSKIHMKEDLLLDFKLKDKEIEYIEKIAVI